VIHGDGNALPDGIGSPEAGATSGLARLQRTSRAAYWDAIAARRLRPLKRRGIPEPVFLDVQALVGELLMEIRSLEQATARAQEERDAVSTRRADLLETLPIPCVVTDARGVIVEGNREAALLMNTPVASLAGRDIHLYFTDRDVVQGIVASLRHANHSVDAIRIKPREKLGKTCRLITHRVADAEMWRWFFLPH
jgi:PAS domain-containing protein